MTIPCVQETVAATNVTQAPPAGACNGDGGAPLATVSLRPPRYSASRPFTPLHALLAPAVPLPCEIF